MLTAGPLTLAPHPNRWASVSLATFRLRFDFAHLAHILLTLSLEHSGEQVFILLFFGKNFLPQISHTWYS
jgi:hypothetical protein